ncbi:hypothetical protein RND71_042486 [Anisodus tanguticus]|uniref:Uncharacterized protein n=1 Tax=Anisodus tanguticus TaxID=243964 RepID=A0AAE1QRK5_9SOLA|nr:hypothetical protein RND71_042486 [Anisodus tanguticus]
MTPECLVAKGNKDVLVQDTDIMASTTPPEKLNSCRADPLSIISDKIWRINHLGKSEREIYWTIDKFQIARHETHSLLVCVHDTYTPQSQKLNSSPLFQYVV